MGSKLKLGRCRFNGGVEQEPGQHRHVLRRCLASVVAVSLSIVCMVPAAYAQDVDDVNGSSNSVILGGVFLCFCQLLGELTCRDSGWLSWARFALPVASGVLSRVARFRLRGLVPGRGFRF